MRALDRQATAEMVSFAEVVEHFATLALIDKRQGVKRSTLAILEHARQHFAGAPSPRRRKSRPELVPEPEAAGELVLQVLGAELRSLISQAARSSARPRL